MPAARALAIAKTIVPEELLGPNEQNNNAQMEPQLYPNTTHNVTLLNDNYEEDDNFFVNNDEDTDDENGLIDPNNDPNNAQNNELPSDAMRSDFQQYIANSEAFMPFHGAFEHGVRLLHILRSTKSSLETYDKMFRWHLETTGVLRPHEKLSNCPYFISKKSIYSKLRKRYNRHEGFGNIEEIVLPYSKKKARIVWNDAAKVIQSLLTDPRILAEDYAFFGQNPFAPPPNDLNYIADLNTGKCYIDTYNALITDPERQILVPTPLYIDGAATGQFVDLPITPVQIALGIHTRKARDKPHCWGTLGYIPDPSKVKSHGKRQLVESGHVEGTIAYHEMLQNEGQIADKEYHKAQDLHTMIAAILKSYQQIQQKGLIWDLVYNGKIYKGVELVFFIPFIKCDTDEADKLCGSYTSRGANIAQLCRYCECPTMQSCDPLARFPLKTKGKVQRLVEKGDMEALKGLSQQFIDNAFYPLRFGAHSDQHIHGATPLEMLHHMLLGIFANVRDTFFQQIGPTSATAQRVNALAVEYGALISRQSDRSMPKTKFFGGIVRGKLTAKEYPGILLVMYCLMLSGQGQMLLKSRRVRFREQGLIQNWIMLIETLLQWEMWLKSTKMMKSHVQKSRKKHKYIMQLMRKISNREEGMGMNTTKFHGILHMTDDILAYGVPLEFDTGTKEQHHSVNKAAAKLTQKNKEKFEEQVHKRAEEVRLLDLAVAEMNGYPLFRYFESCDVIDDTSISTDTTPDEAQDDRNGNLPVPNCSPTQGQMLSTSGDKTGLSGKIYGVQTDQNGTNVMYAKAKVGGKYPQVPCEQDFIDFLVGLQDLSYERSGELAIRTLYTRKGIIFRADFCFHGSSWRDWVIVNWGREYGELANKLWGFVDLRGLPSGNSAITYGGLTRVVPGIYAVVESTTKNDDPNLLKGEMMTPILTEVDAIDRGFVTKMRFYLAEVEAFVGPAVVVPDIGGPKNAYFWLKSREKWANLFEQWLSRPCELIDPAEYEDNLPADLTVNDDERSFVSSSSGEDSESSGEEDSESDVSE